MVPNNDTAAIKRKMQSIWKESLDQINAVWLLCEGEALGFTRSPEVEAKISPRQDGQALVAVIMVLNKRSWPSLRVIYKLIMKLWDIHYFKIMRLWMIFYKKNSMIHNFGISSHNNGDRDYDVSIEQTITAYFLTVSYSSECCENIVEANKLCKKHTQITGQAHKTQLTWQGVTHVLLGKALQQESICQLKGQSRCLNLGLLTRIKHNRAGDWQETHATYIWVDISRRVEGDDIIVWIRREDFDSKKNARKEMYAWGPNDDEPQDFEQGISEIYYCVVLYKSAHAHHDSVKMSLPKRLQSSEALHNVKKWKH